MTAQERKPRLEWRVARWAAPDGGDELQAEVGGMSLYVSTAGWRVAEHHAMRRWSRKKSDDITRAQIACERAALALLKAAVAQLEEPGK